MSEFNLGVVQADTVDEKVNDYFSNYFKSKLSVNANDYDVVKGFFSGITDDDDAIASLTASVLQTAAELEVEAVDVIETFKSSNSLNSAIPMFLNMSRRNTSLLGYLKSPPQNTMRRQIVP